MITHQKILSCALLVAFALCGCVGNRDPEETVDQIQNSISQSTQAAAPLGATPTPTVTPVSNGPTDPYLSTILPNGVIAGAEVQCDSNGICFTPMQTR